MFSGCNTRDIAPQRPAVVLAAALCAFHAQRGHPGRAYMQQLKDLAGSLRQKCHEMHLNHLKCLMDLEMYIA